MQRGLLTGIILGLAMTIFTMQNPVTVSVRFLWLKFAEVPLALLLVISLMTGVLVNALFAFIDKQRLRSRIRNLNLRIKQLEDQSNGEGPESGSEPENGVTIEGEPGHKFFDY